MYKDLLYFKIFMNFVLHISSGKTCRILPTNIYKSLMKNEPIPSFSFSDMHQSQHLLGATLLLLIFHL